MNGVRKAGKPWQDTVFIAALEPPCGRKAMTRSMRFPLLCLTAIGAALPCIASAMTCYTLYDRSDAVVYRGTFPPIDMSPDGDPQRDAMRAAGQYLVFGDTDSCPPVEYRFGDAGNKTLSIDEIIGGIRPMKITRSNASATAAAAPGR